MLPIEALQEKICQSELGQEWIANPLLDQDVWAFVDLGYTKEELKIRGNCNLYFKDFSLHWLKLLAKLTVLTMVREKLSVGTVNTRIIYLRQLDKFLVAEGYIQPELLTDCILQKFVTIDDAQYLKQNTIAYVAKLWTEEQWLKLPYINRRYKIESPKIEIIPEEVLHQIYENFDLFPPPLERLFRLQLALGCRISEMLKMPRQCLKKEGVHWFLLRWVQKRKHWRFYQVHPAIAELVKEQQKFLNKQFGSNSDFDKLFCRVSTAHRDGVTGRRRFEIKPIYTQAFLNLNIIGNWLRSFAEQADLLDKYGNRFELTSHKFRRTKASVMAYCEAGDEYIAAILGHGSLDMLPHYRKRSLKRLEKEANIKGYVDMYGRVTSFKPKKLRYERLAELLKVTISLGECHRPIMLGDCQYRYACLSCEHHRITLKDKSKIKIDIKNLQQDLEQAENSGQERRMTEINRLLELLKARLQGLQKIEKSKEHNYD